MPIIGPRRGMVGLPAAGGRGNDAYPNVPFRSPAGGGQFVNPAVAGGGSLPLEMRGPQPGGLHPMMQSAAAINYGLTLRSTFNIPFGNAQMILPEPLGIRQFLQIRNARQSDLACNINFNTNAEDPAASDYELLPGEWISFEGLFMPQNRVFAFAAPINAETGGNVYLIVTYSDVLAEPANV